MWSARDVKLRGVVQAREVERRLSAFGSLDLDESVAVHTGRRYRAKHRVAYTRTRRTPRLVLSRNDSSGLTYAVPRTLSYRCPRNDIVCS